MTNKEAVRRIRDHMQHHGIGQYPHLKLSEALEMAISALDNQPTSEPMTLDQLREMQEINRFEKTTLTAEQVYTFTIRLCDNEVDRDFERFSIESLRRLGELFVGKRGICSNRRATAGQTARIYRTEVVENPERTTMAGELSWCLKGWAYMLRSEENRSTIEEIKRGIKKEISAGCSMGRRACSVCGGEIPQCGHTPGNKYDGNLCTAILEDPTDAYEWAFVETPVQRDTAHIDREAMCGSWEGEADGYADGELVYDVWRCGDCGHVEETDDPDLLPRFCPSCGRAMTPEAWAELEKRISRKEEQ